MNSVFRPLWLHSSKVNSNYSSRLSKRRKTKWLPVSLRLTRSKFYLTCVVYTNTNIHLSVGEIGKYVVNKPLAAAGISDDNAQGSKIVRKVNSWPRSEASRATVKF